MLLLSKFQHTIIALLIQGIAWLLTGSLWLGAILAIGFFAGREHNQAEMRYMALHKLNRSQSPWSMGFSKEAWNADSFFNDLFIPAIAVCVVAIFLTD